MGPQPSITPCHLDDGTPLIATFQQACHGIVDITQIDLTAQCRQAGRAPITRQFLPQHLT